MLGSQHRLSPVLSALLIASLHPLPGFTVRFGLLPSAPSHGRLVLAWLSLVSRRRRLSCLCYHCGCVAAVPSLGTEFVPTTAVPSLGDGICAYCCHTIIVRWYMCFSTAVQTLGGCICAYLLRRRAKVCLLCSCCSCLHSYAINVCGSLCVTSA